MSIIIVLTSVASDQQILTGISTIVQYPDGGLYKEMHDQRLSLANNHEFSMNVIWHTSYHTLGVSRIFVRE